jgi:hypothetical protein
MVLKKPFVTEAQRHEGNSLLNPSPYRGRVRVGVENM